MGLTCSCDFDDDYEPGTKLWMHPDGYTTLGTKRSRKCGSCGDKINVGDTCVAIPRIKVPETEVECRIYGEDGEIPIAPSYLCETCADLCFSLEELGFCMQPGADQRELVKEYADMQGLNHDDRT